MHARACHSLESKFCSEQEIVGSFKGKIDILNSAIISKYLLASFNKFIFGDHAIPVGIEPQKYIVHMPLKVILADLK